MPAAIALIALACFKGRVLVLGDPLCQFFMCELLGSSQMDANGMNHKHMHLPKGRGKAHTHGNTHIEDQAQTFLPLGTL